MSGATILPDIEADVLFEAAPPAESVRTTGEHQSVQCDLVSGELRQKVWINGDKWRSVPVGRYSSARVYSFKRNGRFFETLRRGDAFELWAEARIGSGIVLATHHPDEDIL